jgi:hypothetical protein
MLSYFYSKQEPAEGTGKLEKKLIPEKFNGKCCELIL